MREPARDCGIEIEQVEDANSLRMGRREVRPGMVFLLDEHERVTMRTNDAKHGLTASELWDWRSRGQAVTSIRSFVGYHSS